MERIKKILLIILVVTLCLPMVIVNAEDEQSYVDDTPTSKDAASDVVVAWEDGSGALDEAAKEYAASMMVAGIVQGATGASGITLVASVDQFGSVSYNVEPYEIHFNQNINEFVNQYSGLSALTKGHMSFVGVLVTLLQYDNNLPEAQRETELGKIFFKTSEGVLAGGSADASMREVDRVSDKEFVFRNHLGSTTSCGHSHEFPDIVRDYDFKVTYGSASSDILFGSFPKIEKVFDFSLGGITSNFKAAIFNAGNNGTPKGLVKTFFPKGDKLKEAFNLPNLNIVDYFETYFLKFEPVYRYFPAALKEKSMDDTKTPFVGQSGDAKKVYGPTNAAGYENTTDEDLNMYPTSSYYCGDKVKEEWDEYPSTSPDTDGTCPSSYPNMSSSGNCYYVDSKSEERDCFVAYLHYYFSAKFQVPTGLLTPRTEAAKGNNGLLSKMYSSYYDGNVRKKAVAIDGTVISGQYDYIIGSTYKNAIASAPAGNPPGAYHPFDSTYNKYLLVGNPSSSDYPDWRNKVVGMAISSLMFDPDECIEQCIKIEDPDKVTHSSDAYLKCAQSFCDSFITYSDSDYATNDKRDCIVNNCKYKPKNPIDCSNPTGDSIMLMDRAALEKTAFADNSKSCCGFTVTNELDPFGSKKSTKEASVGAYSDCKGYGVVNKVEENGISVYKYGTGNVDNSYINVLCEESSSFDFISLANKVIEPGTGFEYPINLNGSRNCELFFDYVSWTYDFASTHSLDRVRKRMLLQKVEAFNLLNSKGTKDSQISGSDLLGNNVYYSRNGRKVNLSELEGDLPIVSSFNYSSDTKKASVTATTEEYVNGTKYTGGYSFYNGGDPIVYDRTGIEQTSNMYLNNDVAMPMYNKYNIGSTMEEDKEITEEDKINVNSYKIVSSVLANYQLPKVCVDETNKGTVRTANNEGMCESFYGTKSGLREYYTDFRYKNHDEYNRILANTYVARTDMDGNVIGGSSYLRIDDTCHYSYDQDVKCSIIVDKKPACYLSNTLILENDDSVNAILKVDNVTTSTENIKSQLIYAVKDGTVIASDTKNISVPLYYLNTIAESTAETLATVNDIQIYGQVVINDGTSDIVRTCSNSVTPIKVSNNGNCTITSVGNDKYKISINGIDNPTVYAGTGIQKDASNNLYLVKIEPDPNNGNFYFTRIKKDDAEVLIAKVEGSNGSAYCQLKFTCDTGKCCTELYKPVQERDIKEYCENNYSKDCRRYSSSEECFNHCTMSDCEKDLTEEERENLETVEDYCTSHYTEETEISDCITTCYANYDTKATFRPINLNNPFPYSKYVDSNYNAGNRKVGVEWIAAHNTISEDASQIKKGQKVEYKIHLTSSDIRAISKDTQKYNESLPEGSIYQYTTNGLNVYDSSECISSGYTGFCSKFINASEFSSLFSVKLR